MIQLTKYSLFEDRERAYGEHVKSELVGVAASAKELIPLFPVGIGRIHLSTIQ
jgi:hypothetical protein